MKKFKSYGFWTAFSGAVIVFLNALGDLCGFQIESELVSNLIMAVAGILVAVGVVTMGEKKTNQSSQTDEPQQEDQGQEENIEQTEENSSNEEK